MRGRRTRRLREAALVAFLVHALPPGAAVAEETGVQEMSEKTGGDDLDTEHIFGFAEGSSIGDKGEREIEAITIGSFGKVGSYNAIETETSLRATVTDRLRLSVGTLSDAYAIQDVQGLDNRHAFAFSGVIGEARCNLVDNRSNPFGLSLSFNPSYRQFDQPSGAKVGNTTLPVTVLFDREVVRSKLYVAFNVVYAPTLQPRSFGPQANDVSLIAAATYAVSPKLFLGAEVRHETLIQGGLVEHALFLGPSLYYDVAPHFSAKVAWAIQASDFGARSLDLDGFERHQVELQLVYGF